MYSPEDKEIFSALQFLQEGKVILYPSDTIWGIGGDATMDTVGEQVIWIKERAPEKGIIVLVDGIDMLSNYVQDIPKKAKELIEESDRPTTIIYPEATGISEINKAPDGSIGIRVIKEGFVKKLISSFGKPISSSSANISSEPSPKTYKEISSRLKNKVAYEVDVSAVSERSESKASSILSINVAGEIEWIRK